ncbi:MAG TPA: PP2C family protein-serine/threonine phosphatase [Capsulimonadaceae bacterium]|nr:PP2C family protein-serine/threonine phosphatase [Capsulimonadaceae bacterium]
MRKEPESNAHGLDDEQAPSFPSQGQAQVTPAFEAAYAEMPLEPPSGGDFHAAFPLHDGSGDIGVVIGDVSGHGPEAAVQAERVKQAVAAGLKAGHSPAEVLRDVNGPIEADPGFQGFATVFAGLVDADTGKVHYANGGHEPGLVAPADGATRPDELEELVTTGPPVGVAAAGVARYDEKTATLPEGGTLLLYTDGISEARSPVHRDWYGVERVKDLFGRFANMPLSRMIGRILASVFSFCNRTMRDDFALLAIRRRPRRTRSASAK